MQELIRRRRRAGFVGRRTELADFRGNFATEPDDERRRFLFNIHGDAGVGKTLLVEQFQRVARDDAGAAIARADEKSEGLVATLESMVRQLAPGSAAKQFDKALASYRHQLRDTQAPADSAAEGSSAAGRVAAGVGLAVVQSLPVVGPLAGTVSAEEVSQAAHRVGALLGERAHAADAAPPGPAETLTPPFVELLRRLAREVPWIALFFDTYERTEAFLGTWLLDLVEGRYGDLPANLVVTVAGQHRLHPGVWAPYLDAMEYLPLLPFTEEEARRLLADKGVTAPPVVEVILAVTGRLPVLVATLAESRPADISQVGDSAGDAVDRFLKWESQQSRRTAALACALPRTVNQDVVDVLLGGQDGVELYEWLRGMPFVQDDAGSCHYHEVVRTAMVRLERTRSPRRWRARHRQLERAWRGWRDEQHQDTTEGWWNPQWQDCAVEEVYHMLCGQRDGAVSEALHAAVRAAEVGPVMARRIAEAMAQAGEDTATPQVRRIGQALAATVQNESQDCSAFLGLLLEDGRLDGTHRVAALSERAWLHQLANRLEPCLEDVNSLVALEPENADPLIRRGLVLRLLRRHQDSLADLDRVLAQAPDNAQALVQRGSTFEALGRDEAALTDYDGAVHAAPGHVGARIYRARLLCRKGLLPEALAGFDEAAARHPNSVWVLLERAECRFAADRIDEALDDLRRALALDPDKARVHARRGFLLCRLGHAAEAIQAFDLALEADPTDEWALTWRGWAYFRLNQDDAALEDLDRAVEMSPDGEWQAAARGWVRWGAGRYEEALPDLRRAVSLDPDYAWAWAGLALTLLWQGRSEEAHEALGRAVRSWSRNAPYAQELADRAFGLLDRHHRRDDEVLRGAARAASAWLAQNRWDGIRSLALPLLARGRLSLLRDSVALLRYTRSVIRAHPDTGPLHGETVAALVDTVVRELPEAQSDEPTG
jgi:tetratricopeptide (TPR) repeat protein